MGSLIPMVDQLDRESLIRLAISLKLSPPNIPVIRGESFKLNPAQAPWYMCPDHETLLLGANRSGKSEGGGKQFIDIVTGKHPVKKVKLPCTSWILGPDFDVMNQPDGGVRSKVYKFLDRGRIKKDVWSSQLGHYMILQDGTHIQFKSNASDIRKFGSVTVDVVWIDEETNYDKYQEIRMRIFERLGYMFMTMTPDPGRGVSSWVTSELLGPESTCTVFYADLMDNKDNLPSGEIEKLEARYPEGREREARIHGRVATDAARRYPAYNKDLHYIANPLDSHYRAPDDWCVYRAIDPHPRNPTTTLWWAITPYLNNVICRELCLPLNVGGVTIERYCKRVHEYQREMFGDRPAIWTVIDNSANTKDPTSGRSTREAIRDAEVEELNAINHELEKKFVGVPTILALKTPEKLEYAREWVQTRCLPFRHGDNNPWNDKPAFYVSQLCPETHWQLMNNYFRDPLRLTDPDADLGEKPMKRRDHCVDDIQYIAGRNPRYINPHTMFRGSYQPSSKGRSGTTGY